MTSLLPNVLTCLNLLTGCCACVFALSAYPLGSLYFLIAAMAFDSLDGLAARKLNSVSAIGKELDSLADIVSFGLVPSLVLFEWCRSTFPERLVWISFVPLLLAVFSALRLAKFDIDTRQTENFLGLPTPANAMLIVSITAYAKNYNADGGNAAASVMSHPWVVPLAVVLLGFMLVSELPFFSLKFRTWGFKENLTRYIYLIICALTVVISLIAKTPLALCIFWIFAIYIVMCLLMDLAAHFARH